MGLGDAGTITRWLRVFHNVPPDQVRGCSDAELREIESAAGHPLPKAYRQFMLEAGRSSGGVFGPYDEMHYPGVLRIRETAEEVIRHARGDLSLLDRAFPFYDHEVYDIRLIDLTTGKDDPPVLQLSEITGLATPFAKYLSMAVGYELFEMADFRRMRVRSNG